MRVMRRAEVWLGARQNANLFTVMSAMSYQNKNDSKKRKSECGGSDKRLKTGNTGTIILDVNNLLKNFEPRQVNDLVRNAMSSGSNIQSNNVGNLNSNASSSLKEVPESNELLQWIKDSNVPTAEADKLLVILRKRLIPNLPKTTASLESNEQASVWIKMESEDALEDPVIVNQRDSEAEENDGSQGFMFVDMSQKQFPDVLELDDSISNIKPDIGAQILQQLKENSQRLDRIEQKQNQLIKFIMNKKLADISEIGLETMYDLQIPLASFEQFDDFEKQLSENELFQTDVCAQLANCVDRKDCSLSKSYTNMFRTFMTKDLVVQFTAIRKSTKGDKRQFSTTRLSKLMTGVLIKSRKERNLSHDSKDLNGALSEVISHAHQWNVN